MRKSVKSFFAIVLCLCVFATQAFIVGAVEDSDFISVTEGATIIERPTFPDSCITSSGTNQYRLTMRVNGAESATKGVVCYAGNVKAMNDGEFLRVSSRYGSAASTNTDFRLEINWVNFASDYFNAEDEYNTTGGFVYEFDWRANDQLAQLALNLRTAPPYVSKFSFPTPGKWVHVKVVYDNNSKKAYTYFDGVLKNTAENITTACTSTPYQNLGQFRIYGYDNNKLGSEAVYFDVKNFSLKKATVSDSSSYTLNKRATNKAEFTSGTNSIILSNRFTSYGKVYSDAYGVLGKPGSDAALCAVAGVSATAANGGKNIWFGYDKDLIDAPSSSKDIIVEYSIVPPASYISNSFELNVYGNNGTTNKSLIAIALGSSGYDVRPGMWNKIKMVYNTPKKTFNIYLNGKKIVSNKELDENNEGYEFKGRMRNSLDFDAAAVENVYFDNFFVYEAPTGVADKEDFTSTLPTTWHFSGTPTVAQVKEQLASYINSQDTVSVFSDGTYTTELSDTDTAVSGAVIVTRNSDDIFQYCTLNSTAYTKPEVSSIKVVKKLRTDDDGNALTYTGTCSAKTPCTDNNLYSFETEVTYKNLTGASYETYAVIEVFANSKAVIPDDVYMVPVTLEPTNGDEVKTAISNFNNKNLDHNDKGTHKFTWFRTFLVDDTDTFIPLCEAPEKLEWKKIK